MVAMHHAGGRLGNILFQIAACQSHAWRNGTEAMFPEGEVTKYFPNLKRIPQGFTTSGFFYETGAHYQEIPYYDNMTIVGYFQSWKYYSEYRGALLDLLNFPYSTVNRCSLHIRRGDYLEYSDKHPGVPKEYIEKAMWFMCEKGFPDFEIFSDDIEWCRNNINTTIYPEYNIQYNTTEDPYKAMSEMANCQANICASSTFSLWAAELNRNPDKIVVTPAAENYYGPSHRDQHVADLIRPEYHKIAWNQ